MLAQSEEKRGGGGLPSPYRRFTREHDCSLVFTAHRPFFRQQPAAKSVPSSSSLISLSLHSKAIFFPSLSYFSSSASMEVAEQTQPPEHLNEHASELSN